MVLPFQGDALELFGPATSLHNDIAKGMASRAMKKESILGGPLVVIGTQ
jgi:hypothetical protein